MPPSPLRHAQEEGLQGSGSRPGTGTGTGSKVAPGQSVTSLQEFLDLDTDSTSTGGSMMSAPDASEQQLPLQSQGQSSNAYAAQQNRLIAEAHRELAQREIDLRRQEREREEQRMASRGGATAAASLGLGMPSSSGRGVPMNALTSAGHPNRPSSSGKTPNGNGDPRIASASVSAGPGAGGSGSSPARANAPPPRRTRSSDVPDSGSYSQQVSHTSSQSSGVDLVPFPEEKERGSLDTYGSNGSGGRSVPPSASSASTVVGGGMGSVANASAYGSTNTLSSVAPPYTNNKNTTGKSGSASNSHSQTASATSLSLAIGPPANAETGPQGSFKTAKLVSEDLPTTLVRVEGSTIRSNDRGKEVLSFVIGVSAKGKESWKIEKLYSDVLALDARVRSSSSSSSTGGGSTGAGGAGTGGGGGKGEKKKLAPLPDNKLFKDNAPAKVDARKAALELYLQSLVGGVALKKRDDVCMFFSTGVVRPERTPVHQLGHKEGYLTKRSKNFGGCVAFLYFFAFCAEVLIIFPFLRGSFLRWKTRYFVLAGSTLEYFESVCRYFFPSPLHY